MARAAFPQAAASFSRTCPPEVTLESSHRPNAISQRNACKSADWLAKGSSSARGLYAEPNQSGSALLSCDVGCFSIGNDIDCDHPLVTNMDS